MNVNEWIETHGTADLQRALKEGYAVDMGVDRQALLQSRAQGLHVLADDPDHDLRRQEVDRGVQ